MKPHALPRYLELPKVEICQSGDFRRDFLESLKLIRDALEREAINRAIEREFPAKPSIVNSTPDPQKPAVAASVVRQVIELAEAL